MAQAEKKNVKKVIIGVIVLVVLLAAALIAYFALKPKTDAEYLRQAMDEADGLTYGGSESDTGMMVDTINGLRADYTADKAYWSFYINGEYCNFGIDQQPIADGDQFKIEYTAAE